MNEKKREEKIGEALLKVALGYQVAEVTEEYAEVDGTLKLTKRKKTKKDVPPDLKAVQMLLAVDNGGGGMETLSDEELHEGIVIITKRAKSQAMCLISRLYRFFL